MAATGTSGQGFQGWVSFSSPKRANPTVTQLNFSNISGTSASTATGATVEGFICRATGTATGLNAFQTDWTAESELS